jgi:hypothetical protein
MEVDEEFEEETKFIDNETEKKQFQITCVESTFRGFCVGFSGQPFIILYEKSKQFC